MVPTPNPNILYAAYAMSRLPEGCGHGSIDTTGDTNTSSTSNPSLTIMGADLGLINPTPTNNRNIMMMGKAPSVGVHQEDYWRSCNSSSTCASTPPLHHHHHHQDHVGSSSWLQLGVGDSCNDTPLPVESGGATRMMLDLNLGGGGGDSGSTTLMQPQVLGMASELMAPRRPTPAYEYCLGSTVIGNDLTTTMTPNNNKNNTMPIQGHQRFQFHLNMPSSSSSSSFTAMHPPQPDTSRSSQLGPDFRLIYPPPTRPQSGIWFMLQPSFHPQSLEPYLPQVPKKFLRIKDGRIRVEVVIKYVVNKLGLDSESQVEIRCRGQVLQGCLTLQTVRDEIWLPQSTMTTTTITTAVSHHHLMLLHYAPTST